MAMFLKAYEVVSVEGVTYEPSSRKLNIKPVTYQVIGVDGSIANVPPDTELTDGTNYWIQVSTHE